MTERDEFVAGANIDLLEARLASGELDGRAATTARALLLRYYETYGETAPAWLSAGDPPPLERRKHSIA